MIGAAMQWKALEVERLGAVAHVKLNRPTRSNALDETLWRELREVMRWCDASPEVHVVVLSGNGKNFCAGLDLSMLNGLSARLADPCEARKRENLRELIVELQASVNSLERCRKPVIAAVHGACIGGGLDIALAADFRYASSDAIFSVREVDMAMVADVGTLQRLPRVVGEGVAREWALTGCEVDAEWAHASRLVNCVFPDREQLLDAALTTAGRIAQKSPLAVRGTEQVLNYSRDHSIQDGLEYVANWNAATLISEDLEKAVMAGMSGQVPEYRN
jgi:enoyl-CoA hydratase